MDDFVGSEHPTHSFVLRIWVEERSPSGSGARWRGCIVNVQSDARRSVDSLVDVHAFLVEQLARAGLGLRPRDRMRVLRLRAKR
jgi:hypothetical protein